MLYIITAVHNRYDITKRFIRALKEQEYNDFRLLLVDDGSTDGTSEMVMKEMPNAIILKGNGDLWWGGALQVARNYLLSNIDDCKYIMFINDDTRISKDFIKIAIKHLKDNPNNLVTSCGYSLLNNSLIDGAVYYNFREGTSTLLQPGECGNCASTRALFMTFGIFEKIGGFHPVLLPHYASDYEYTIRAAKKGYGILSFKDLSYKFDPGTTGDNDLKNITLSKLFSKRSRFNPIYRLIFCAMVTPVYYIPLNIFYGIKRLKEMLI